MEAHHQTPKHHRSHHHHHHPNKNGHQTPAASKNNEAENLNDPLPTLEVLSLTRLPCTETNSDDATITSVLIANHPSYLYNAGKRMTSNSIESLGEEEIALLEKIMIADLIAARWQVRMGLDAKQDPHITLQECCQFWRHSSRRGEIHELINTQAFILQ